MTGHRVVCRPPARLGAAAVLLLSALAAAPAARGEFKNTDWPYTPLAPPTVPQVRDRDWVRNPVDAFVLAKLERAGLRPNPPADRLTLLRRVTFDLTGLLPTPAQRDAFLADHSPDAYEKLVDRLLASPHFGERWAQHYLDVVRYAETEGFKFDRLRPDAYRYRDYVIRAFNADLPYDRFVRQQLAGDELEPDNPDALIATGLLRLHPEESNGSNYSLMRQDILNDVTDVFGSTFLGLTVGCARCHDHKFDPILQSDYYRLQAFFAPLVHRDGVPLVPPAAQERYRRQLAAWSEATRTIRAEMDGLLRPMRQQIFEESVVVFDPQTQTALRTPPQKRTALQCQLAVLASKQIERRSSRLAPRRLKGPKKVRFEELRKKLAAYDPIKPSPMPVAMAVGDAGPVPPPTHLLAAGSYLKPRAEVRPGFPEFLDPAPPEVRPPGAGKTGSRPSLGPRTPSSGRRSALARWLTRPDHPLTARVLMNRVWQHHLGRGIVATPNDFGVMGGDPSHPELLDYLAAELVRRGWKVKALHRIIVTSAAYRQSSRPESNPTAARAARADPDNKLLWHARVKRREAEAVRDAALQVAGRLNPRMFGHSAQPELPKPLMESRYSWDPDQHPEDRDRRSIYVLARRNLAYPLFGAFDMPDRINSCPTRATTITAPQALVMLNGEFTLTQARHLTDRLLTAHGTDPAALVRRAYLDVYGRGPDAEELAAGSRFLAHQAQLIGHGINPPRPREAFAAAVLDFCHALLNSAEFLDVE